MKKNNAIEYAEKYGIYEIYKQVGNVIIYYSYYKDGEPNPFIKVTKNIKTGKETRKRLRYTKTPAFLIGEHGVKYNYYCG